VLRTDQRGAIRIDIGPDGVRVDDARRERPAVWRPPGARG
jgi:beta-lactamase superfamily II metal-dependent hydrolase